MPTLLVAAPFALAFYRGGESAIFGALAGDAMYYLAVAKNTVARGFFTFDQETVTNGFQPLWQYLLVLLNALLRPSRGIQLFLAFGANLVLVAIGLAAVARGAGFHLGRSVALTMPFFLLPGAFTLFFEPAKGHYVTDPGIHFSFSAWAFVNGMESGVVVAALGLFLMAVLGRMSAATGGAASVEIFSGGPRVWLALVVLARLDDVFLAVGVAASVLLFDRGAWRRRVRHAITVLTPLAVLLLPYVIYNRVAVGAWGPVSGLQKVGYALPANLAAAVDLFSRFSTVVAARTLPLLLFAAVGAALFGYVWIAVRREGAERPDREFAVFFLAPVSLYLLLKSLFLITLVDLSSQGWWYYSGQIFVFNFLVALGLIGAVLSRVSAYRFAVALAVLVGIVQIVDTGNRIARNDGYARTYARIWAQRDRINDRLAEIDGEVKVIDNADGLYGFILDLPAAPVTGLTFSPAAAREAEEKGTVRVLMDRGFDVLPVPRKRYYWQGHYVLPDALEVESERILLIWQAELGFYRLSGEAASADSGTPGAPG